jgi:hypothetical protein
VRIAFIALLLLSSFYLMTAEVYEEGGFGVALVVKPYPSRLIAVGGGEDGSWRRDHPGEPEPWWQRGSYIRLIQDDWEGGMPWWVDAYIYLWILIYVAWFVLAGVWGVRYLSRRRGALRS